MIPVAANHTTHVVDRNILPGFIADMLPAGDLFQNQQSDFIAGIDKVPRLRVMRGANNIALQLVAKDIGVTTLNAPGHGLTDPREGLMAIQPPQLDDFAVQLESVVGELSLAEAEATGILI